MNYGDSVQKVLLRKIQKAEQDLVQLKLDYCRFIFGLTHRSKVVSHGNIYLVRSVDVDSMQRQEDGSFSKPEISGIPEDEALGTEISAIGHNWELLADSTSANTGR